ncbi:MAG: AAA family ATPase [Verrucomicrobiota bacterium]
MFGIDDKSSVLLASEALAGHFSKVALHDLVTASRTFPITSRVDLQTTLDRLFAKEFKGRLVGVHGQYVHETLTIAHLMQRGNYPVVVSPIQHEEVDVGEVAPARCIRQGMWLSASDGFPFALLLSPAHRMGMVEGVHLEIAVPPGQTGSEFTREFLDRVGRMVAEICTYRGKVLSFEIARNFTGAVKGVRVHKLESVARNEVILPEKTLRLLERNVHDFIGQRSSLRALGMAAKKGLLFYGPPGTGKTHTIRYLAGQLRDHTTFLITAEQMGLLEQYFQLARFLQPAIVVIEDVDLIARARTQMRNSCEENLLNYLLNEMDGLREDAAILFILTTNHPEQLEEALASRPGRIDQAIEFPLPDDEGRRKLIRLYARGLPISEELVATLVRKTVRSSGAFIKEMMRRAAQYLLQRGRDGSLALEDVEGALDEMLFSGGSLNLKLLGAPTNE